MARMDSTKGEVWSLLSFRLAMSVHNDDEMIMIDDDNDGNDGSMTSVYMR